MPHFKAFGMIDLQYEIRICKSHLAKASFTELTLYFSVSEDTTR